MASTSYNTLTLGEEEPRKARSPAVYVALGLAVVAMAGVAAVLASGATHTQMTVNAEFSAAQGSEVNCDENSAGFLESLPKYDPEVSKDPEAFYNACYYSFRCCTTTGNNGECYVSENFGNSCRQCLKENAPRMTRQVCTDYAKGIFDDNFVRDAEATAPAFTMADIEATTYSPQGEFLKEAIPQPNSKELILQISQMPLYQTSIGPVKTCWPQGGAKDLRVKAYSDKCFEVLSWCNLLCPRDAANSVEHKMCKHCTLMGFAKADPTVKARIVSEATELGKRKNDARDAKNAEINQWNTEWSVGPQ